MPRRIAVHGGLLALATRFCFSDCRMLSSGTKCQRNTYIDADVNEEAFPIGAGYAAGGPLAFDFSDFRMDSPRNAYIEAGTNEKASPTLWGADRGGLLAFGTCPSFPISA